MAVSEVLRKGGYQHFVERFEQHGVCSFDALPQLTERILREELGVEVLGDRLSLLTLFRRALLLGPQPDAEKATTSWDDDAGFVGAFERLFEAKRRLFEAADAAQKAAVAADAAADLRWMAERHSERVAALEAGISSELARCEADGRRAPRIVRLCRRLSLTPAEQTALVYLLVLNVGSVFPPLQALQSPAEQRGVTFQLCRYAGLSSQEVVDFLRPARKHMKDGLIVMDSDASSSPFGAHFLAMDATCLRCLLGCHLDAEEMLALDKTALAAVIAEESSSAVSVSATPTQAARAQQDSTEKASEDREGEGKEEVDSDAALEDLMREVELEDALPSPPAEEDDSGDGAMHPYTKDLQYLEDQFRILELRFRIRKLELDDGETLMLRQDSRKPESIIRELRAKERVAVARLEARLAKTRTSGEWLPRLERLMELRSLRPFEKGVLIALVGGQISDEVKSASGKRDDGLLGKSFEVSTLLSILCSNLEERILSRMFFYKSATLVKENLIQLHEPSFLRRGGGDLLDCTVEIDRRLFDYIVGLDTEIGDIVEGSDLFTPTVRLETVVLAPEKKKLILDTISNYEKWRTACKDLGFDQIIEYGHGVCILFHGPPGTGKTMTAHGIANHLGKRILQVSVPTLGDATVSREVLRFVFREAVIQDAIVFFDECESLFETRANGAKKADTGVLLTEIEKQNVLIIMATNRPKDLDEAMHRRITLEIEFPVPDFELREMIWKRHIPERLQIAPTVDWSSLALQYEFSGGAIKNSVLSAVSFAIARGETSLSLRQEDLEEGAKLQLRGHLSLKEASLGERRVVPVHSLADVVVPAALMERLVQISQFEKAKKVLRGQWGFRESSHSTTVCIFHGALGTGRRLAAEALGYELGRPLQEVSCSELASIRFGGPKVIETLFKEARMQNSILLFVDAEALFSATSLATRGTAAADIGFLLHNVSCYGGLALFVARSLDSLDASLLQATKFVLEFPKPNPELRERLWRKLIPEQAPLAQDVDIQALAVRFAFSGGTINSSIVRASEVAALRHRGSITQDDIVSACIEEQRLQSLGSASHASSMFQQSTVICFRHGISQRAVCGFG